MRAIVGENFQSNPWRAVAREQSGESSSRGAIPGDQFQNIAWRVIAREQSKESIDWESNPRRAFHESLASHEEHPKRASQKSRQTIRNTYRELPALH
jgi:hypothetical protein